MTAAEGLCADPAAEELTLDDGGAADDEDATADDAGADDEDLTAGAADEDDGGGGAADDEAAFVDAGAVEAGAGEDVTATATLMLELAESGAVELDFEDG